MRKIFIFLLIVPGFFLLAFTSHASVNPSTPGAYDLIATVNALRASKGLPPLQADGALMAAAQVQSEYLASIGGPNITDGHQGAGGTYAIDRARAAGYPVVLGVDVVECWAWARSETTLDTIVYDIWGDDAHMGVMLHQYGKHVGAGVTEKDGNVYYILDVAVVWGSSGTSSTQTNIRIPTTTPGVVPVKVATPRPDGSITHFVEAGQAPWSIAIAYGITIPQLRALNNLSENAPIYAGEELIIRVASTPMPTATETPTLRPPTRTPVPPQLIETNQPSTPITTVAPSSGGFNKQTLGLVLVLVSGVGIVLILLGVLKRENKK